MSALDDIEPKCAALAFSMGDSEERDDAFLQIVGTAARERYGQRRITWTDDKWLHCCQAACATFNRRLRHLVGHCHMVARECRDGTVEIYYVGGVTKIRPQATILDKRAPRA